jgi:lipid II isoglutaminyl synthase (glutamine-hydrolysing)
LAGAFIPTPIPYVNDSSAAPASPAQRAQSLLARGQRPSRPASRRGRGGAASRRLPARARLAALAGASLSALSRATGRGGGSVVGGHAILALEPRALARFSAGRRVVLVSGTNGKTTTTKFLARALSASSGSEVVTNLAGANLPSGLAATLAAGKPGLPAVLEVDEAWLPHVAAETGPEVLVLLNLSRDQLDRNNEVRQVAQRWREACHGLSQESVVVANADDPLVAWAGLPAARSRWVGAGLSWTSDAGGCPQCGGKVAFHDPLRDSCQRPLGGRAAPPAGSATGGWACASCGLARPPLVSWLDTSAATGLAVGASGDAHELALQLPGRCNQANAVIALEALRALGYGAEGALRAMAEVDEVAGRYATAHFAGTTARLLLAKNPAGWTEIFDMLAPAPGPVVIAINARTADGHDPSWLWDVQFERLRGRRVIATGERRLDLAVRLHYAEVDHACLPDLLEAYAAAGPGAADVVANYTAFYQMLSALRQAKAAPA